MKKIFILIGLLFIVTIFIPYTEVQAKDNGVDDLRGRWDLDWTFLDGEPQSSLILYINDWRASEVNEGRYYAAGCMRTLETGGFMPLSLRADYRSEDHSYDVQIYSTTVLLEYEPFVIRFDGNVQVHGNGVTDDAAGGTLISEIDLGEWTAEHHDRRRTKCPSISGGDLFQAELYSHRDLAYDPAHEIIIFDTSTVIVSSAMLVEDPYGNITRVEYYTDLFSPDIDFIGRFRFTGSPEVPPVEGMPYTFTLLDVLGRPIDGAVSTDTWNRCNQGAPMNFVATPNSDNINLSWDAVQPIPNEFDPGNYQITMWPMEGQAGEYGSDGIQADNHNLPLYYFDPGSPGFPDGWDFGQGLLELENGPYQINVWAWNQADETNGGWGSDCGVLDSSQGMIMTKEGNQLIFEVNGTISGHVFDTDGNPLESIGVDTEDGGYGTCTDEFGFYSLDGLPLGSQFNVVAGRDFCDEHPFEDQIQFDIPVGSTDIDFYLTMATGYNPTLHIVPAYPEIHGHDWNPEATVTIFVYANQDEYDTGIYLYTESKLVTDEPTWCIEPCFDVSQVTELPDGIQPGYVVTMTDGEATRVVHTTSLVWTGADPVSDTVFGTAAANAWIEVEVHGPEPAYGLRLVQADVYGDWVADFSIPGTQDFEQDILDLEDGYHGRSIEFEAGIPDDGTLAYWQIGEPPPEPSSQYLNVQPDHGWADSGGWVIGDLVTISFGSFSATQTATDLEGDPGVGHVWFDLNGSGISPGSLVHITDGIDFKDLDVVSASFDAVDVDLNTAGGTGPAGMNIGVAIQDVNGDFFWAEPVLIPTSGNWFVDFDDYGGDFDVVADAWVHVFDEDGDSTIANLYIEPPPEPSSQYLNVQPDHGWADSGGWVIGDLVTISFGSFSATQTATDSEGDPGVGHVWFDLNGSGISPGSLVHITDGIDFKDLDVVSASFDAVDVDLNTAGGTGPAGMNIGVAIQDVNGDFFWAEPVLIPTSGNWFVDFDDYGGDFDVVADAWVHVFDEDGDSTIAHLNIP